ncbi:MAG: TolC family protein [Deltaproteobacteria bacterium]|nr:TolC family protein [Deltaproteobacteria bacterium]
MSSLTLRRTQSILALAVLALSAPAFALQPLADFLASAQKANPDALEAAANVAQQEAQADIAFGKALPGISLRGTYTRNQYASEFTFTPDPAQPPVTVTIQPLNQLDFYGVLNVPLIDLAQFKRISNSKRSLDQTKKQLEAIQLQVNGQVVQSYFQLVANQALVEASKRQLEVSKQNLALTQDKFTYGSAPELEVDRAKADVERIVQQEAAAELQTAIAARALGSASGLTPVLDATPANISDDLHEEPALDTLFKSVDSLPTIEVAGLSVEVADGNVAAQKLTLVPTLAGSFTEHIANSGGFAGSNSTYTILLSLNWAIDFTTFANIRSQEAAAEATRARAQKVRLAAQDEISREWNSVKAGLARSQSARAELKASRHAAELAQDRYKAGAATQLDLLQAERDAFTAEVSRIQADADLANSRAQLKLSTGQSLTGAAKN